ncbi:uncharacterized protein [Arachis hypogaea]|uniref:uncharacterized protein n=1 Tax=Arachis hypogaea TaxID=3818 RepID=UPI003B2104A6
MATGLFSIWIKRMEWNKGMEARLSEFCDEAFVLDTIEKKKVIVEDSSPEQAQSYHREKEADLRSTEGHYVSFETIPEVNLGSDDHLSQGHTDQSSVNKPVESMLSLVEENMMVLRVETQSQTEALSIVPIQVCLPLSQSTTVLEIEPTLVSEIEPTPAKSPSEKVNEETTKRSRIILGCICLLFGCILFLLGCIHLGVFSVFVWVYCLYSFGCIFCIHLGLFSVIICLYFLYFLYSFGCIVCIRLVYFL